MREFYAISFVVDPSVLIPRPETEHLVEYVVQHAEAHHGPIEDGALKICEIGTGCGNLCIVLAKHLPQAQIVSMDISSSAILVANKNLRGQPDCCERIRFLQGDLLEGLHPERAKFHLIVSNPPYVPTESWHDLPPEIRDYEPRIALDGGRRGTEILDRILRDAAKFLLPGGTLVVEIGEDQAEELLGKVEDTGHYRQSRILEDYAGKPRVLVAMT
jgi:release factor glutamine methyltransferase